MRNRVTWSILGWLVVATLLTACGQPAPRQAPTTATSAPASAPTALASAAPANTTSQSSGGTLTIAVADLWADVIVPVVNVFTSDHVKFNIERYVSDASPSAWPALHRQTVDHVETQLDKDFFAMTADLDANKRLAMWHSVQQQAFALHSVLGIARVYDQYASATGWRTGPGSITRVHPSVQWAKLKALVDGAALASAELWA